VLIRKLFIPIYLFQDRKKYREYQEEEVDDQNDSEEEESKKKKTKNTLLRYTKTTATTSSKSKKQPSKLIEELDIDDLMKVAERGEKIREEETMLEVEQRDIER
jgi:hypothetical protein